MSEDEIRSGDYVRFWLKNNRISISGRVTSVWTPVIGDKTFQLETVSGRSIQIDNGQVRKHTIY